MKLDRALVQEVVGGLKMVNRWAKGVGDLASREAPDVAKQMISTEIVYMTGCLAREALCMIGLMAFAAFCCWRSFGMVVRLGAYGDGVDEPIVYFARGISLLLCLAWMPLAYDATNSFVNLVNLYKNPKAWLVEKIAGMME